MDDHFDKSGVFEISKFDISKLACIWNVSIKHSFDDFDFCNFLKCIVHNPKNLRAKLF